MAAGSIMMRFSSDARMKRNQKSLWRKITVNKNKKNELAFTMDGNDYHYEIYPNLDLMNYITVVDSIAAMVVDNVTYAPAIKESAIGLYELAAFTSFEPAEVQKSDDTAMVDALSFAWDVENKTNAFEKLAEVADLGQLRADVEDLIDFKKQTLIRARQDENRDKFTDAAVKLMDTLAELADAVNKFEEKAGDLDIGELLTNSIAIAGKSEKEIVDAIVDSPVHEVKVEKAKKKKKDNEEAAKTVLEKS
jgi:hypothetical protein